MTKKQLIDWLNDTYRNDTDEVDLNDIETFYDETFFGEETRDLEENEE